MDEASNPLLTVAELAARADFSIGEIAVSPSTRAVRGPGGEAVIEPRVMQVLVVLAETVGAVVTRDTLFARCWGGVYVGDDSLNRAIGALRRIVVDVGGGSVAIETIPRTGYVLSVTPDRGGGARPPHSPRFTRRLAFAGSIAGAGALALAGWHFLGAGEPAPSPAIEFRARGLDALRYMMPERDAEAVGLLNEAVRVDPDYAPAWGTLALAYRRVAEDGPPSGSAAATQRAVAAARRALQLDPGSADAQAALALLRPSYRDWLAAEARFRRLLARNSDHGAIVSALARLLFEVGRVRESVAQMAIAMRLDPLSPSNYWRRMFGLWSAGDLIEAERVIERATELFPRHADIWFARFWLLATSGRASTALAMARDAATRPVGVPQSWFDRIILAARAFQTQSQADIAAMTLAYASAARETATGAEVAMLLASAFGRLDEAFDIADAYFFDRGFTVPSERLTQGSFSPRNRRNTTMLFWPPAAAMRSDARFAALTRGIGLASYWRRAGVRPDFMRQLGQG